MIINNQKIKHEKQKKCIMKNEDEKWKNKNWKANILKEEWKLKIKKENLSIYIYSVLHQNHSDWWHTVHNKHYKVLSF